MGEKVNESLVIIAYASKILDYQDHVIEDYFHDDKYKITKDLGHFLITGTECDEVQIFKSGIAECKKNLCSNPIEDEIINVSNYLKSIVDGLSLPYPVYSMYMYQNPDKYQEIFNKYRNDPRIFGLSFAFDNGIRAEVNLKLEFQFTVSDINNIDDIIKIYKEIVNI